MSCFIHAEILNQNLILIIVNPHLSHKETKTYFIKKRMYLGFVTFEIILELFKQFNGRTAKYKMNINKWQNKIII